MGHGTLYCIKAHNFYSLGKIDFSLILRGKFCNVNTHLVNM